MEETRLNVCQDQTKSSWAFASRITTCPLQIKALILLHQVDRFSVRGGACTQRMSPCTLATVGLEQNAYLRFSGQVPQRNIEQQEMAYRSRAI